MPNYLVQSCISDTTYIVDISGEVSINDIYQFTGSTEEVLCGTVLSESTDDASYTGSTSYSTCCGCYSGNGYNTFIFETCEGQTLNISLTGFCEIYSLTEIPRVNEIFLLFYGEVQVCGKFLGVDLESFDSPYLPDSGPYDNCSECGLELPPLSAGTNVTICYVYCSGNTQSIEAPHPTWTMPDGRAVVLLDAVVLGGPNGLNG